MTGLIRHLRVFALLLPIFAATTAQAQTLTASPLASPSLDLPRGALVFHGNYCGPGDRGPGRPPIDALDRACMHHDACTPTGGLPSCSCNDRLHSEAMAVSTSPRQPQDLRALAGFVAEGAALLPCNAR